MIIDKNEWLIRNVLKSKLHTCVASEYGVAEFLSTSNDPNIGIPELEGLSCCCGTILRAENYNKFLLITSLLICDRDDTHCTRKKIRSVEGTIRCWEYLSFLIRLFVRIFYSIFHSSSLFFFFSSFFSRLLLFPFYDGIRIVLVIIIAYFDCQCIIITITITTIIALRHVYLDEQNKDNFSRMAVTINDETCDKITMRGDYTVKMYRRSQDRRQYATSLLLSRNIYLSELQARNNFSLFARTTMIRGAMRHGDNVDAASWRKTKERLFFNVHALYTKHYKDK